MTKYEQPSRLVPVPSSDDFDSGITVLDLWRCIARYKFVVLATFAAAALAGMAVIFWLPAKEKVSTVIEIGTRVMDNKVVPLEVPAAVLVKIREGYIPLVQNEQNKNTPERQSAGIKATVPKFGEVVVLESFVPPAEAAMQVRQHTKVVALVRQDHERVLAMIRNELQQRLNHYEGALARLQNDNRVLTNSIRRNEEKSALLQNEIKQMEQVINAGQRNWEQAIKDGANGPAGTQQLVLANELLQNRAALAALRENVLVKLPNERDRLQRDLDENQRDAEKQKAFVEDLRMQLANLKPTRALGEGPWHENYSERLEKTVILVVSLLLGLIIGVGAALIVDHTTRARHTQRAREALVS